MQFTYHTRHSLEVCNCMVFGIVTELCKQNYHQFEKRDIASKSSNPRYRQNEGLDGLSHIPKVTELVSGRVRPGSLGIIKPLTSSGAPFPCPGNVLHELKPAVTTLPEMNVWHVLMSCSVLY